MLLEEQAWISYRQNILLNKLFVIKIFSSFLFLSIWVNDNYYELHYHYNYNWRIEILVNLPLLANFAKIKLHLKYLA